MADAATTPEKKDLLLSQCAHEIRSPASVIMGYGKMLSGDRMGPLTDMQRHVVGEISKAGARLAELADEMSDLARLLEGGGRFLMGPLEIGKIIADEIAAVASAPERDTSIRLIDHAPGAAMSGDATRLRRSFNSLMFSHRLELVTSHELCVAIDGVAGASPPSVRVTMAGADRIDELRRVAEAELEPLVTFRSGLGYKLSIAGKVIEAHGGRIFSATEAGSTPKASRTIVGAVMILPLATG